VYDSGNLCALHAVVVHCMCSSAMLYLSVTGNKVCWILCRFCYNTVTYT